MRVLAIDPGTRLGWAYFDGHRRESGVQTFDLKRGESPGMRWIRFNTWLETMLACRPGHDEATGYLRVDLVIFEQAHHRGGAATQVLNGFVTRIEEACARHGIDHTALHSGTLKKWTTGSGNAKKPEMIAAVQRRFMPEVESLIGVPELDDNEADAVALLEFARAELVPADGAQVDGNAVPRSGDLQGPGPRLTGEGHG